MLDYYTKKAKQDDKDCKNFLGIEDDSEINNNIKECYNNIVNNYLNVKFSSNKKIYLKEEKIKDLTKDIKKIINSLSPSFRDLKDSMNINDYIKVKVIKDENFSTRVIDGFAMTKNVCSKKMREKQEKPKILILDLDLNEHKIKEPLKKKDEIPRGLYKIENIKKKIVSLEVNVILLNKGIGNLLLESLLTISKLVIIVNVKSSSLRKIARCTKGEVISSLNQFLELDTDKNNLKENPNKLSTNFLGSCIAFEIKSISGSQQKKLKHKKDIIEDFSTYDSSYFNNLILSNNRKLMIFDGCNNMLFQTLLLYGQSKQSLSEIKNLLKNEIFSTVREFFLEKNVLYYLFCNIPPKINDEEKEKEIEKKNEEESKQIELEINNNSLCKEVNNKMKDKINPFEISLSKQKCSADIGKIVNTKIFSDITNEENVIRIGRRGSDCIEDKEKLKNRNNNISTISNKIRLDNDVKKNNINQLNKDIHLLEKTPINKVNNSLNMNNNIDNSSNDINKRNNSNLSNIPNLTPLSNNEKMSFYLISNINKGSSKDLKEMIENSKQIKEKSLLPSYNKNSAKELNSEKSDKKAKINLELTKYPSECFKYNSNKIVSKIFGSTEQQLALNKEKSELLKSKNTFDNDCQNKNINKICFGSYINGFDTSPIITNKTSLKLIRLSMCKGDSNIILNNPISNSEKSEKDRYQIPSVNNSITENALLKSLNFICENMEVVNLIYYKSKYRENDKSLSKALLDIISEIDKPVENAITSKIEENQYIQKIIIDSIEEKDKFLSKMIIEMLTENEGKNINEKIEEKYKLLGNQILDNMSEKKRNFMKIIIDTIGEKDKCLCKMIIDMIAKKENPLNRTFIDMIAEKDKIYGKKIVDILGEKYKPLCENIIGVIADKDKQLGKTIIDMISEKDKPLGKIIIDITAGKENKCNKCKNPMANHFYYLYDSNFSRIKIELLTNSDSNLEKIINFLVSKNEDFKKNYLDNPLIEKIDYNSDIYFYGFCQVCKDIVTPLIKMHKDLFNYSSAKFFKHIFNNEKICNRNDVKKFNISSLIEKKECKHLSFHNINRIFITRYGSLKFEYEKIGKYDLIAIQNIPDKNHPNFFSKEINSLQCLKIITLITKNLEEEHKELIKIKVTSNNNNISFLNNINSQTGCQQLNIIDLTMNLLNSLKEYLKDEGKERENPSSKNMPEISLSSIPEKESLDTKENDSIEKFKKISQLKLDNSSENLDDSSKKDISKFSDKDKKFREAVDYLMKKCEDNYKTVGFLKKIYFKIAQTKVLYNKIRSILNIIKILISLELILRDEENKNKSSLQLKTNNSNLSFIADKNANKAINTAEINNNENKDKEEIKNELNINDSMKSKTPKVAFKTPDKIINNHKVEGISKVILGDFNLPSNNDSSGQKENDKSNINNNNNSNIEDKKSDKNIFNKNSKNDINEICPFKSDPNKNFLKLNSVNATNIKKENIPNELKINLEKSNNVTKEDNIENKNNENQNTENKNIESKNIENGEKIILPTENLIKLLVGKYVTTFNDEENYSNINENEIYKQLLETINFYDSQQNEYPNAIKEKDLSSIVSYAISSSKYKNFIKGKTILLDIKRDISDKNAAFLSLSENNKKDINLEKKNSNEESVKKATEDENIFLYNSLLLFDSSNINFSIQTSDSNSSSSQPKKTKINRMLEAEILCKDSNSEKITINIGSLNEKKFEPQQAPSRKMTMSRQTINNTMTSPNIFSPQQQSESDKTFRQIETDFETIDKKMCEFYGSIRTIKDEIKKISKCSKFESISKAFNTPENYNFLNNNKDEISLQKNNSNNINNKIELKKNEILSNFVISFNKSKLRKREKFQEFSKKPDEGNINIIDAIGKLYFSEELIPQTDINVIIYYPRQFEALRIAYCCTYEDLILSITQSYKWEGVSGGKSNASFYKTKDEKYLFKSINKNEFNMFLEIAYYYFQHIDEYLFHKMPSVLMKILGVYEIRIRKNENNKTKTENYYLMMMENLNYGFNKQNNKIKIKSYDLKGSTINRYIQNIGNDQKGDIVLLDSNFKQDFKNEPLPLKKDLYGLLLVSVYNDTLFLSKMGIIDYSLLLHIKELKEYNSEIRVGIIDYVRKYTWDKKLEHLVKTIINGFNSPTIINPNDYKERFLAAIKSYFIGI